MKKLTTILTACLFVFALSSCGGDTDGSDASGSASSVSEVEGSAADVAKKTVGWPAVLMNACVDEMVKDIDSDSEMAAMSEMIEMPTNQEIAECACEAMSNAFPNINSMEEMAQMNDEVDETLMIDCFGDGFKELMEAMPTTEMGSY